MKALLPCKTCKVEIASNTFSFNAREAPFYFINIHSINYTAVIATTISKAVDKKG